MNTSFPQPDSIAIAHSNALMSSIQAIIAKEGGWINFAQLMDAALYTPGLGYYSGGAKKFGLSGDFVTASEISPLFSQTIARQTQQVLSSLQTQNKKADILELGAGTGRFAKDLLFELAKLEQLPARYMILEVSAHLREEQHSTLKAALPNELMERVVWLDALPRSFDGLIFANEVLDALPVHIVRTKADGIAEIGVVSEDEGLVWKEKPASSSALKDFVAELKLMDGYTTEVCLAATGLVASLAGILQSGMLLMIDYGFSRTEYYHPQRNQGTLMCHYRHRAHGDPLVYLGLQDITAHVDFTRVAETGVGNGLELIGFLTQAQFLINAGITELLESIPAEDSANYLPLVASAQKLLSPAEMGDLFKVIAFEKNLDIPFIGFSSGDKSHTL
ncbi:MAG: SAM-dependent methyltransferase [Candidatus Methylopumilus sp.]|jgi:SAM-dependent MidA family methyltransferase|nr:SAM-dependent methyltransferase [Candidatus Methylopumilus sp.]